MTQTQYDNLQKLASENSVPAILILSGEGEVGTWERYTGKLSDRAIKTRLTKESCGGDRWASAWAYAKPDGIGDDVHDYILLSVEGGYDGKDVEYTSDWRSIDLSDVD